MADADLGAGCLLNKKIRNAQLAQYNFILGEITYCFTTGFSDAFAWFKAGLTGYFCTISLFVPRSRVLLLILFHYNFL